MLFKGEGRERETKVRRVKTRELSLVKKYSRFPFSLYMNFLQLFEKNRFGDYFLSRKWSEMEGGKFKNLPPTHKGTKRCKDKRLEGTWKGVERRKKERERGRGRGKGVHASKLSRAIIPSWRVQRQRERTLPGIKVLQTCGKCSWGRAGRPRSNQTNRGTYRP